jgi:GNAT superfamily N-acetyltransferase
VDGFTRVAAEADIEAIVRLVNHAYEVESFFVRGDRVSPNAVRRSLETGTILVVDGPAGTVQGCVFVTVANGRGYFGMLAVDPAAQGHGLGRRLVARAEAHAREAGATTMDISVVNVRADLIATYSRMGYTPRGTEPYEHRPTLQPVHFVLMEKRL